MEMTSTAGAGAGAADVAEGEAEVEHLLPNMTLSEALEKWVSKHPDKRLWTYLDDRGQETSNKVTYRELDDRTKALGLNLLRGAKGRGPLSPGDRVLLVYPPSLHFSVAFVACLRAGLVAVPVYPPDPRKLRKDMQAFARTAASCGATVALTSSVYDHAQKASAFMARLTGDDSRWPDALQWLVTDKPLPTANAPSLSSSPVVADEATAITTSKGGGATEVGEGSDRSSLAFLQYTSGSTGDPKGVKISHGNLAHNLGAIIEELKAGSETVVVSWLPQYHDMGLIGSVLGTLYCGGSGYYLSPLDFVRSPPTWITAVDRFRATHLQAPNFAFALTARKWKALKTKPAVDLSSVVHLINAAEPIDASSLTAFEETFRPMGLPEGVIKPTYGLAEHTVFVCSGGVQRITVDRNALEIDKQVKLLAEEPAASSPSSSWCKLVGCGYPARVKGLDLLVVEPNSGQVLPEDRVGEVWLRSPSKAHGYWGLPERSREAFCAVPSPAATSVADTEAPAEAVEPAAGKGGGAAKEKGEGVAEKRSREDATGAVGASSGDGDDPVPGEAAEVVEDAAGGSAYHPVSALELHSEAEGKGVGGPVSGWSEGYLRTGDEGFLHEGELFICGRIKDLVIVGGRNHYPQDLERTAERGRNETIRPGCSAAFSVPGEEGGELLVLTTELREEQVKVSDGKQRELGEEIRSAVVSEHGVDVHHLLLLAPKTNIKTTSGKIARQWCRRAFLDGKMKPLLHLDGTQADSNGSGAAATANGTEWSAAAVAAPTAGAKGAAGAAAAAADGAVPPESPPTAVDPSTLTDEQLLMRLQRAVAEMGDGSSPDPDAPFYTFGLSSMTGAQFSGLLQQEYGAHVPLSVLDADNTTLRYLVPLVKAGTGGESGARVSSGEAGARVPGVVSSETMVRESPGKCEETITNSCPCCMCLLSCPCCM
eukprot:g14739.t1